MPSASPNRPPRCKRRTVETLLNVFTSGLGEVFASAAAAFLHQPKALCKARWQRVLVPFIADGGIIGDGRGKVKENLLRSDT